MPIEPTIAGELRLPDSLFTLWLPSLTFLLFALACSWPGNRWIDWIVWVPALVAAGWPWKTLRPIQHQPARRSSPAVENASTTTDQLLQQLTRFRTADGNEAIRGTLLAEFAAGERTTTLYVAFCPPFERLPNVEAQIADDSSATVKVAQRLHNGAQFDVRLPEWAEHAFAVLVELFVTEPESC